MFFYFPFTYLPGPWIGPLTRTLGPMALLTPPADQAAQFMTQWVDAGMLQLCTPADIDSLRIDRALKEFDAWAALQGGEPGDLKRFFQAAGSLGEWHGGPPTAQIRSRLRQHGSDRAAHQGDDALFNAAVFLALAHRHDQQQEALAQELGSIHSLETRFGEILGDAGDRKTILGPDLTVPLVEGRSDPGTFMTVRRIRAWAELAGLCDIQATFWVTTSQAVRDMFCEDHPRAIHLLSAVIPQREGHSIEGAVSDPDAWQNTLDALARADDPGSLSLDHLAPVREDGRAGMAIDLYVLAGSPPHAVMGGYSTTPPSLPGDGPGRSLKNCVVVHVNVAGWRI